MSPIHFVGDVALAEAALREEERSMGRKATQWKSAWLEDAEGCLILTLSYLLEPRVTPNTEEGRALHDNRWAVYVFPADVDPRQPEAAIRHATTRTSGSSSVLLKDVEA